MAYLRDGLGTCAAVETASAEYLESMDDVDMFIEDWCEVDPSGWESSGNLFASYGSWAQANGAVPVLNNKAFTSRLKKKGYLPKKQQGQRGWCGVRVRPLSAWHHQGSNPPSLAALASRGMS